MYFKSNKKIKETHQSTFIIVFMNAQVKFRFV